MEFTKTIHRDSPRPLPLRRYAEFGDAAIEMVKRAISQTQTVDDANDEIQHFKTMTSLDVPAPTKWGCFFDAVTAVVDAAARAETDDRRQKLGVAALKYLDRLLASIKREEAQLEVSRGYFITSAELAGERGIGYLTECFGDAVANGRHINFEI